MDWFLSLPQNMLLVSERDCMYYMYQLHRAAGILEVANNGKAGEYAKKVNDYNGALQSRLYGEVGKSVVSPQGGQDEEEADGEDSASL